MLNFFLRLIDTTWGVNIDAQPSTADQASGSSIALVKRERKLFCALFGFVYREPFYDASIKDFLFFFFFTWRKHTKLAWLHGPKRHGLRWGGIFFLYSTNVTFSSQIVGQLNIQLSFSLFFANFIFSFFEHSVSRSTRKTIAYTLWLIKLKLYSRKKWAYHDGHNKNICLSKGLFPLFFAWFWKLTKYLKRASFL